MKKELKVVAIAIALFAVFLTGCPNQKGLRETGKVVNQFTGKIIVLRDAFVAMEASGKIDRSQRDEALRTILAMLKAEKALNDELIVIEREFGDNVPIGKVELLRKLFSDEMLNPFFDLLQQIGRLSPEAEANIRFALAAVKSILLTISIQFDKSLSINETAGRFNANG